MNDDPSVRPVFIRGIYKSKVSLNKPHYCDHMRLHNDAQKIVQEVADFMRCYQRQVKKITAIPAEIMWISGNLKYVISRSPDY